MVLRLIFFCFGGERKERFEFDEYLSNEQPWENSLLFLPTASLPGLLKDQWMVDHPSSREISSMHNRWSRQVTLLAAVAGLVPVGEACIYLLVRHKVTRGPRTWKGAQGIQGPALHFAKINHHPAHVQDDKRKNKASVQYNYQVYLHLSAQMHCHLVT